jgi:hypothetical protein
MAPITSLAGRALLSFATITVLSEAQAGESARTCADTISILNDSEIYDAFDKQNGGGEKRLRFRLNGRETCDAGECKLEVIARPSGIEKVIAAINLAGRAASSYCVGELSRIKVPWNRYHLGCPARYLLNALGVTFVDRNGPFAERQVTIEYVYNADAGSVGLDTCTHPSIADGVLRERRWTVPLEDGSAVHIEETDFPRSRRFPIPRDILDLPYATSVFGAKN